MHLKSACLFTVALGLVNTILAKQISRVTSNKRDVLTQTYFGVRLYTYGCELFVISY
jgi:hypothetical protein